jgi:undecaprenyl-diphosphatase
VSAGHVVAAVAAVLLAAGAIYRRRQGKLGGERLLMALVAAVALGVYASGVLSGLPSAEKIIEDLAKGLGQWTYLLVGLMAFLETGAFVGLIAPGEFTVIVGGVIAGQGTIELVPLLGLVWLCCVLGDTCSYFIGRKLGRQFLERHGPKVKITHERLGQVDDFFEKHGGRTILIGRFIGLVRALAPFIAGSSGLPYSRFIPYSVIGTGLWSATFTLLGYFFYQSFDTVANYAGRATFVFGTLVFTIFAVRWAYKRLRQEEERRKLMAWLDRQGRKPLLRPLAAIVRPVWRRVIVPAYRVTAPRVVFFIRRLTPGDLGLELTTALAVSGVGFYVFTAYAVTVADDPGPTLLDDRALELADDVMTHMGVEIAKVVTALGSLPVVGGLVLIGAVLLAVRRRPIELAVLVASAIAIFVVVHVTKGAIDRPRPPHPLAGSNGAAFPSGHAAYSTAYVAIAVIAARVLPGKVSRVALVLVAGAIAAAVGATRIYLRVHWWSDVVAGWALGAAIFGLFGAIGVVVGYMRNNGSDASAQQSEPAAATPNA